MAATVKNWTNNNPPQCEDVDLNGFKLENNNLIEGSGQILDDADRQQSHKAVAYYAAGGDFYTDSGTSSAYVLSTGGARVAPPGYFAGMRVRFVPGNVNGSSATVDVDGLGAQNIVQEYGGSEDVLPGMIDGQVTLIYDGTNFALEFSVPLISQVALRPTWTGLTEEFTDTGPTAAASNAVAAMSSTRLAVLRANSTDTLTAFDIDYSTDTITQVGNSLSIASVGGTRVAICAMNESTVVMLDSNNQELRVYSFDGTDFALVGVGNAVAGYGVGEAPALASLSETSFAMFDAGNQELRLYTVVLGTGVTTLVGGSGTAIAGTGARLALTSLSSTDVAFSDISNGEMRRYKADLSTGGWTAVGAGFVLPAVAGTNSITAAVLNLTDIVYYDATSQDFRILRSAGAGGWTQNGPVVAGPVGGGGATVAAVNGTDFVYFDSSSQLRLWRGSFVLSTGSPHLLG